jgi:cyclophilin family peptidyl-prolyl cis-trans isomerase
VPVRKVLCCILAAAAVASLAGCPRAARQSKPAFPVVAMETSMGTIKAELWPDKSPVTVRNFLRYVDEKHYDGTIFHRVKPGFMVQGGGLTPEMAEKPTHEPIANEAGNGLRNRRGTLAMARTGDVDSATDQFFINTVDNAGLDHNVQGFGYAVFGKVIEGMDVVDRIERVETHTVGGHEDVPVQTVLIRSIRRAPER